MRDVGGIVFSETLGFSWDENNKVKNWVKHKVLFSECEEVFFNKPLLIANDEKHSQNEIRWFGLGKTDQQRLLFVVFTIRRNTIRVISARDMNKNERSHYYEKDTPKICY